VDDPSSFDSQGLSNETCEVLGCLNKQGSDIGRGVHVGNDDMDVGAGDQGIMFGCTSAETEVVLVWDLLGPPGAMAAAADGMLLMVPQRLLMTVDAADGAAVAADVAAPGHYLHEPGSFDIIDNGGSLIKLHDCGLRSH